MVTNPLSAISPSLIRHRHQTLRTVATIIRSVREPSPPGHIFPGTSSSLLYNNAASPNTAANAPGYTPFATAAESVAALEPGIEFVAACWDSVAVPVMVPEAAPEVAVMVIEGREEVVELGFALCGTIKISGMFWVLECKQAIASRAWGRSLAALGMLVTLGLTYALAAPHHETF